MPILPVGVIPSLVYGAHGRADVEALDCLRGLGPGGRVVPSRVSLEAAEALPVDGPSLWCDSIGQAGSPPVIGQRWAGTLTAATGEG